MDVRIVLISGEYPPAVGGVADYTHCLAGALADAGAAVAVLTGPVAGSGWHGAPGRTRSAADASAPTRDDWRGEGERIPVHDVAAAGWGWSSLPTITRRLADLRPDIVHVQYQAAAFGLHPAVSFLPWWLSRRAAVADVHTAITFHDLRVPYLFPKAGRLRELVARLPARTADAVVVTNPADAAELAAWGKSRRLRLIPIGSNIADAPPPGYDRRAWRRQAGVADGVPLVAYFGFLSASKGGLTLLDSLAALRSGRFGAVAAQAELVLVGGHVGTSDPTNAADAAAFERHVARLGLAGEVHRTGHVDPEAVSAWLHAADVVALPYHDGASYRRGSLLAALSHGRPVVTTWPAVAAERGSAARLALGGHDEAGRTGAAGKAGYWEQGGPRREKRQPGPNDLGLSLPALEDGRQALLVGPGDAEAIARAVARLMADPALAASLGAEARVLAARFGWPAIAAHHLALYAELVAAKRSSVEPRHG